MGKELSKKIVSNLSPMKKQWTWSKNWIRITNLIYRFNIELMLNLVNHWIGFCLILYMRIFWVANHYGRNYLQFLEAGINKLLHFDNMVCWVASNHPIFQSLIIWMLLGIILDFLVGESTLLYILENNVKQNSVILQIIWNLQDVLKGCCDLFVEMSFSLTPL